MTCEVRKKLTALVVVLSPVCSGSLPWTSQPASDLPVQTFEKKHIPSTDRRSRGNAK
jgi:hypothetical protein